MLEIVRKSRGFFLAVTTAATVLRVFFIVRFPSVTTDSFVYGDIAKNWVRHGIYGLSSAGTVLPTYIRLPGYPAFLALIFTIFGMEHYRAVLIVQMLVDIGTCFLIANLARQVVGANAVKPAFLLAGLCPFLANYCAAALTETLEIFFTAIALNFAVAALNDGSRSLLKWSKCGIATGVAILLRPDGAILLASIQMFLMWIAIQRWNRSFPVQTVAAMLAVGTFSLAPLVPWTLRNLHTIHRFQPLAPRYANEQGEFVPEGFNRWVKTWMADYVSVEEIYWAVPGDKVDAIKLPDRAFDSLEQRVETVRLIDAYNREVDLTPALDQEFSALASRRVRHAPVRYYVWLPAVRIADMWLRPRTEMLPSDSRWWEFDDELKWSILAVGLGVVGVFYVSAAAIGLIRRGWSLPLGMLLAFVVIRTVFLGTLENPEPRYVLECFPVVIVLAASAFSRWCDAS